MPARSAEERMRRSRNEFGHVSCRARATAFSAAKRRLSATSQNQQASGLLRSGAMAPTAMPPWPAWPTLEGARIRFPAPRWKRWPGRSPALRCRVGIEFHPCGKAVAVEDRRLNQAQRRHGRAAALAGQVEQRGQVVFDAQLGIMERGGGLFAIPGDQVESELRVEDGLREGLEREQTNGLLLEFLHAGMPCSLAGAKIWMTERRMASCAWSRRRKRARAMAAG